MPTDRTRRNQRQRPPWLNLLPTEKLRHHNVRQLLDAYSTQELSAEQKAHVERHVSACRTCQRALVEIGQLHRALRQEPAPSLTDGVASQFTELAHAPAKPMWEPRRHAAITGLSAQTAATQERTLASTTSHPRTIRGRLLPLVASFLLIASSLAVFHVAGGRIGTFPANQPGSGSGTHSNAATGTATEGKTPSSISAGWTRLAILPGSSAAPGIIPSLAWSIVEPDTLYLCRTALTFPARTHGRDGDVLFRSDDRGHTWHPLTPPEQTASCLIQADPAEAGQVILQDDQGRAFVSRDAGANWATIPVPPHAPTYVDQAAPIVIDRGRIFYGAYSTDDLRTWQAWDALDNMEPPAAFAVDPAQTNLLYRLTENCTSGSTSASPSQYGICVSQDGGHTWRLQLALARAPGDQPDMCTAPGVPNLLYVWAPAGIVHGGDAGLYVSRDAGNQWTRISSYAADAGMPVPPPDAPCSAAVTLQIRNYILTDQGQLLHLDNRQLVIKGQFSIPAGISLNVSGIWNLLAPYPEDDQSSEPVAAFALPYSTDHTSDLLALSPERLLKANQPLN